MATTMARAVRCGGCVVLLLMVGLALSSCPSGGQGEGRDYRQDMRDFVGGIASYARGQQPGFVVVPQNGHELLTGDGKPAGPPAAAYIAALSGVGREDLFFGSAGDGLPTPADVRDGMVAFMDLALAQGVRPLVIDYCALEADVDASYALSEARGYLSFAAPRRELDVIPAYPAAVLHAAADVQRLADARSFLYVLNPDLALYPTSAAFLAAVAATDYDVVVMDLFHQDAAGSSMALTRDELASIRTKASGGSRLLLCYMSIGEAEDYRYYWVPAWTRPATRPAWLAGENPDWPGNFKVEYWDPAWQAIIYGSDGAYLDRILAAGFDGVYLDIIDAYEYFEGL